MTNAMNVSLGQPVVTLKSNILDINVPKQLENNVTTGWACIDALFAGDGVTPSTSCIFTGIPGSGKCLGKGTPVLMFDGSIKKVEDIKVSDRLMGPDSKPRTVLSLARGREEMFEITPVKGDKWICNRSHILSLVYSGHSNDIRNITIDDYLGLGGGTKERLKQWRAGVEFSTKKLDTDPYMLGLWLGDGSMRDTGITSVDHEVVEYLENYAKDNNYYFRKYPHWHNEHVVTYRLTKGNESHNEPTVARENRNPLRNTYKTAIVNGEKRIPFVYLTANREQRLELLAGLIDADGSNSGNGFDFVTKYPGLRDDMLFLCRSLGLAAYSTEKLVIGRVYHRISISGNTDVIPTKIARKKAHARRQIKSVLRTGITVKSIGLGDYYGFEIDGDHLFMLGDFTVTHNTTTGLQLADHITGTGNLALYNTNEESLYQVRKTCRRLGLTHGFIPAYEQSVQGIIKNARKLQKNNPKKQVFLIVDSLQTVGWERPKGARGRAPNQAAVEVKVVEALTAWAKETYGIVIIIGQVTKDGTFAGKQQIIHTVDAHLHLEIEKDRKSEVYGQRIAAMEKNRFGISNACFTYECTARGVVFESETIQNAINGQ